LEEEEEEEEEDVEEGEGVLFRDVVVDLGFAV